MATKPAEGPAVIPTAADKTHADVEAMRRLLASLIYAAPEIAAFRKRMFEEHVKAGFTPEQALALCQKLTL